MHCWQHSNKIGVHKGRVIYKCLAVQQVSAHSNKIGVHKGRVMYKCLAVQQVSATQKGFLYQAVWLDTGHYIDIEHLISC